MELYELEKEKKLLEANVTSLKERITLERNALEGSAMDYSKEMGQTTSNDKMTSVIAKIVEMEKDLEYAISKLDQNKRDVDRQYSIYKEYNDRDKQIYIEKKLLKWSNAKISIRHEGMSKRQINRIVKKVKEKFKKI